MYASLHLRQGSMLISKGDHVAAGQQIAQVGNTGRSEGPHLHFEVWQGAWYAAGHLIDPLPVLKSWARMWIRAATILAGEVAQSVEQHD